MDEPLSRRLPLRSRLDEPTGGLPSSGLSSGGLSSGGLSSGGLSSGGLSSGGLSDDAEDDWLSSPRPSSSAFEPTASLSADRDRPLDPFASLDPLTPSEPERQRRARTSVPVVFGLLCSVAGAFAALTAVLAPVAFVLGGLGIVLSVLGLFTAHKPHVSGRLLAVFALLVGLATVALAGIEHVGTVSWLAGDNQPERLRHWLNGKLPFLH
jgi:hypothetical protein